MDFHYSYSIWLSTMNLAIMSAHGIYFTHTVQYSKDALGGLNAQAVGVVRAGYDQTENSSLYSQLKTCIKRPVAGWQPSGWTGTSGNCAMTGTDEPYVQYAVSLLYPLLKYN